MGTFAGSVSAKLPELLDRLRPDVAVISECTSTDRSPAPEGARLVWRGGWEPAGVGVLTTGPWSARVVNDVLDRRLQWVVPVEIDGPTPFKLLAIW